MLRRLHGWWAQQPNRVYRVVLLMLALDCTAVGVVYSSGVYVTVGLLLAVFATWWWTI